MVQLLEKWKKFAVNPISPDEPPVETYQYVLHPRFHSRSCTHSITSRRFIKNLNSDFLPALLPQIALFYALFVDDGSFNAEAADELIDER